MFEQLGLRFGGIEPHLRFNDGGSKRDRGRYQPLIDPGPGSEFASAGTDVTGRSSKPRSLGLDGAKCTNQIVYDVSANERIECFP